MQIEKLPEYIDVIQSLKSKYRSQLQIYTGLEVDYIPGVAGRNGELLKNTPLDYFIGSIHYLDQFSNGEYWNIDTSYELFERGLREIFHNDVRKAVITFWEYTRQMIETDHPDLIGHMDKIKMFNKNDNLFSENEKWYKDQVELTLKTLKKYNTIVEINTRGYYKHGPAYLYPGEEIIGLLRQYQIPVTISSDAHVPDEISKGLAYTAGILLKAGINSIAAFYDGSWKEFSMNEEGILFV